MNSRGHGGGRRWQDDLPEGWEDVWEGDELHAGEGDVHDHEAVGGIVGAAPAGGRHRTAPVRSRRPPRRRRPLLRVLGVVTLLVAALLVAVGLHLRGEISPGGRPGRLVDVTIPPGSSSAQIGAVLDRAGVIHGPSLFRYYVALRHDGPLLPGSYRLAANEGYSAVVAALRHGPPVIVDHLVVPEGYTLAQISERVQSLPGFGLSAQRFLAAATTGQVRSPYEPPGVNNLEGLVFPATYDIRKGSTEADVLQQMVTAFDDKATSLGLPARAAALGMSPYQVVTVASIVEREAKLDADRGGVASTVYNRLRTGIPLGADSTLVYALRQANPALDPARIDFNQASPYNTRAHKGLPPSPIANPGIKSLVAAAEPPTTTNLYFVEINPDGQLGFASSSSGFNKLVQQCRAAKLC